MQINIGGLRMFIKLMFARGTQMVSIYPRICSFYLHITRQNVKTTKIKKIQIVTLQIPSISFLINYCRCV